MTKENSMDQTSLFTLDQPCVRCPTVFCRLRPCCEAQGVRYCRACPYYKSCSSLKCESLTKDVQ